MARMDASKYKLAFAAVMGLETYARTHVPKDLYELIKLRASNLNQCQHCITMHATELRKRGEREERIAALAADPLPRALFSPRELAALDLTDAITRLAPGGVSDEVWDAAVRELGEGTTFQVLMGTATINVWNRVAIPLRLEEDD